DSRGQALTTAEEVGEPHSTHDQGGEIEHTRDLDQSTQEEERGPRVRIGRVDELHEEGDEEEDGLRVEQADGQSATKGLRCPDPGSVRPAPSLLCQDCGTPGPV